MARTFTCDLTGRPVPESEVSTVRVAGPLRTMLDRPELHLSRPVAEALCRWLGRHDVPCPELERIDVTT